MDIGGEFNTFVTDINGEIHEILVKYKGYYFPEKFGLPENSYPAEGEIDIEFSLPAGIKFGNLDEYLTEEAWAHFYG